MALVVPAVKGQMGSTVFYEATMTARELVSSVRPARELDGWATMSIEERMQREISEVRVRAEIVPYIAGSKDRLFGSILVLIYKGEVEFETLKDLVTKIPAAYRSQGERVGFLTIGDCELIVLDGQHRLVALREIIQGKTVEGAFLSEVPNDDICVMFIQHESDKKTRRIFNKVNRYARPTGRGDNIITDEDDGAAIVTRRLLDTGAPLGIKAGTDLIVNWQSNTLGARSQKLTTISAVYETVVDVLIAEGFTDFAGKRPYPPTDEQIQNGYEIAERWWRAVLEGISEYKKAIADPSLIPGMREEDAAYSLLFKPVGQIALFKGLVRAVALGLTREEAVDRANRIDWRIKADAWRDVIVRSDGRIIARNEAYDLAAGLIAYMLAGEKMKKAESDKLKQAFNVARGYDYEHPAKGAEPEPLPKPLDKKTRKAG